MKDKIEALLKEHKFKIDEYETSDDFIVFCDKAMTYWVQIETDDECQFGIQSMFIDEQELLDQWFYDKFIEYGDVSGFEDFLLSIKNGDYSYLIKMFKAIRKLQNDYEEDEKSLGTMVKRLIF